MSVEEEFLPARRELRRVFVKKIQDRGGGLMGFVELLKIIRSGDTRHFRPSQLKIIWIQFPEHPGDSREQIDRTNRGWISDFHPNPVARNALVEIAVWHKEGPSEFNARWF